MTEPDLARCVEHVLGEPPGTLPAERGPLGEVLASRGFALAFVAEPGSF
jgi:hypothetical protein